MIKDEKHGNYLPSFSQSYSLESYIRTFFIDPSNDHESKFSRKIFEHQEIMGEMIPLDFWVWLLEPPKFHEKQRYDRNRMLWSYGDRVALCAAKFVLLDAGSKEFIVKVRNMPAPIFWRGDEIDFFKKIARETYRYNQLSAEDKITYQRSALSQAQRMQKR